MATKFPLPVRSRPSLAAGSVELQASTETPTPDFVTIPASSEEESPGPIQSRRRASGGKPQPPIDQSVAKANEAIAVRPKQGRLTLLSRRIFNVLLYHAQQQGLERDEYTILLSELIDDARFNSKNTEVLKSHLRDMQTTTVEWYEKSPSGDRRVWESVQLLGAVKIEQPGLGRPCHITWNYPTKRLTALLVQPAQYTRVMLEMSTQMRSYAAAVLYELGARYLTSPGRLTMREDVLWWASVLTGRSDIVSCDYRILHRDTIKKALAEIETLNDEFRLELVEHRRGRKVEQIQFRVVPKPQRALAGLAGPEKNTFDLALVDRLIAIGFKPADAQDLYASTDEGAVRAAVEHVEARLKSQTLPPLKSPAAYLRDALKKQYAGRGESSEGEAAQLPAKPAQPSVQEKLQRLREDWQSDRTERARELFANLDPGLQAERIAHFEAERVPTLAAPIARAWRRDGVLSRIASSSFFRWVAATEWPGDPTDADLLAFAMARSG